MMMKPLGPDNELRWKALFACGAAVASGVSLMLKGFIFGYPDWESFAMGGVGFLLLLFAARCWEVACGD